MQPRQMVLLANGLNYQDSSGAWAPAQDLIELTADGGAAALRAQHKVYFSPSGLNDDAALTILTPSKDVFRARILGIYYVDASGQSKLLATPSDDAVAELHPPNQIVYRGAFDSPALQADVRYTCTRSGLESDVIITAQPKFTPSDFGFNPATTVVQVRHQWLSAQPTVQTISVPTANAEQMPDQLLHFKELFLPSGQAFATDGASSTDTNVAAQISAPSGAIGTDLVVGKEWISGQEANMLLESVKWSGIAPSLAKLPQMAKAADSSSPVRLAGGPANSGNSHNPAKGIRMLAANAGKAPGVVLDYPVQSHYLRPRPGLHFSNLRPKQWAAVFH